MRKLVGVLVLLAATVLWTGCASDGASTSNMTNAATDQTSAPVTSRTPATGGAPAAPPRNTNSSSNSGPGIKPPT